MIKNKIAIPSLLFAVLIILGSAVYLMNEPREKNPTENNNTQRTEIINNDYDMRSDDITNWSARELVDSITIGWNLGNTLDSHYGDRTGDANLSQETIWGNVKADKELFEYVASCGFNAVRIPVSWYYHSYTDEDGRLRIHDDWLRRVEEVVNYALEEDMYVLLDSHHDQPIIYVGTDQASFATVKRNVTELWTEIGTYFENYDERLIFDAYNEVDNVEQSWSYSDAAAKQMNELNQVFVDTIRNLGGNNANRFLVVPTLLEGSSQIFLDAFKLPKDSTKNKLIVQVHDYGQQMAQDIEPKFQNLEDFSKRVNTPVIIGEFGSTSSFEPKGYRATHASNFVSRANNHGVKCFYWDDGNLGNFGLVDRTNFGASEAGILYSLNNPQTNENDSLKDYSNFEDFVYMTLNQKNGELKEDNSWGTIVLNCGGNGVEIPENTDYMVYCLTQDTKTEEYRIHYTFFYDKYGNVILLKAPFRGF